MKDGSFSIAEKIFEKIGEFIYYLWQSTFALAVTFISIFLLGVYGFYYFEHQAQQLSFLDALYWTVITMATIGYGDISPQTPGGKIFTSIFAVLGISAFAVVATNIFEIIVTENMKKLLGMGKCRWKNHTVIIGWNESARHALEYLQTRYNLKAVIISPEQIDVVDKDVMYIKETGVIETDFRKANVKDASNVIISLKDDITTIMTILQIKKMNKNVQVIAEAISKENMIIMEEAGADVINTHAFAGRMLASFVFEPYITLFFEEMSNSYIDNNIQEIALISELSGKNFEYVFYFMKEHFQITVIGLSENGNYLINPPFSKTVSENTHLIVLASSDNIKEYLAYSTP